MNHPSSFRFHPSDPPSSFNLHPSEPPSPLLILGGGVIGLSVAHHFADLIDPKSITIIDTPARPGVASRAAAGMLVPHAEFESDSPLYRLCCASYDYYDSFLEKYAPAAASSLLDLPVFVPANDDFGARAERIGGFANMRAMVRKVGIDALLDHAPILQGGCVKNALAFTGRMINPRALHAALSESARERGIRIVEGIAEEFHREGRRVVSVRLADGSVLSADNFVLATGAWSTSLAKAIGLEMTVYPVKGQMARVAAPEGALKAIIHEHAIYLAPRAGEGIVVGATMEADRFDAMVEPDVIRELLDKAAYFAPGIRQYPVVESWCGFRPRLATDDPMIGWSPEHDNVLLAVGHYRNGILLAPITGKKVAEAWASADSISQ